MTSAGTRVTIILPGAGSEAFQGSNSTASHSPRQSTCKGEKGRRALADIYSCPSYPGCLLAPPIHPHHPFRADGNSPSLDCATATQIPSLVLRGNPPYGKSTEAVRVLSNPQKKEHIASQKLAQGWSISDTEFPTHTIKGMGTGK